MEGPGPVPKHQQRETAYHTERAGVVRVQKMDRQPDGRGRGQRAQVQGDVGKGLEHGALRHGAALTLFPINSYPVFQDPYKFYNCLHIPLQSLQQSSLPICL